MLTWLGYTGAHTARVAGSIPLCTERKPRRIIGKSDSSFAMLFPKCDQWIRITLRWDLSCLSALAGCLEFPCVADLLPIGDVRAAEQTPGSTARLSCVALHEVRMAPHNGGCALVRRLQMLIGPKDAGDTFPFRFRSDMVSLHFLDGMKNSSLAAAAQPASDEHLNLGHRWNPGFW